MVLSGRTLTLLALFGKSLHSAATLATQGTILVEKTRPEM
jgi:hypothetical protein